MTEASFWLILGLLNWGEAGNDELVIEPAIAALAARPESEIVEFEEILAQKLYALDTVAHAREIGEEAYVGENRYFSPDWFLYSRCVVLVNGRELYNAVLNDPKQFPKDMEFESLLSIGPSAYERATGQTYEHVTRVSYETYSNEDGWQ